MCANQGFFHRPLPHLDIEKHLVRVDGAVKEILELSAKQLREEFEQHEVVAALQVSTDFHVYGCCSRRAC